VWKGKRTIYGITGSGFWGREAACAPPGGKRYLKREEKIFEKENESVVRKKNSRLGRNALELAYPWRLRWRKGRQGRSRRGNGEGRVGKNVRQGGRALIFWGVKLISVEGAKKRGGKKTHMKYRLYSGEIRDARRRNEAAVRSRTMRGEKGKLGGGKKKEALFHEGQRQLGNHLF